MTAQPRYFAQRPSRLLESRYIVLERHDRRFVAYPRQEATMPECPPTLAAQRLALSTEFLEHARALRELLRLAAEREQCIRDVWAQMMALEAAQRAPVAPRREEA